MSPLPLAALLQLAGFGSGRLESRLQAEVTIQARLPKLNRQAEVRALRSTCPEGAVTYHGLETQGDSMVRREVIDRYLAAESEAPQTSITPSHYRFRFLRVVERAGQSIHIFQLSPRKKRLGLFKGELWLDGKTGLRVRESGRLVKSPSVFIKSVDFVRDYQIHDGIAVPDHLASTVETRLAGRAELDVQFTNYRACQ
jgi:hypothetical protein